MKIRILHVVRKMDRGGVQSMIMNYYRHIDRRRFQFDFFELENGIGIFHDEINFLGGKVNFVRNPSLIAQITDFIAIIRTERPDVIHVHLNFANYLFLLIGWIFRVKIRVSHSHNCYAEPSLTRRIIKYVLTKIINFTSTHCLACSREAGTWLYGDGFDANNQTIILNNAIDASKFIFKAEIRDHIRDELNVTNQFVVGHIGNFSAQKNHKFLIDAYVHLRQIRTNTSLILIGDGELLRSTIDLVAHLGIQDSISFLGSRGDINSLLMAFDVFSLPSLHEGLPLVLIEAQASGLPCVVSDAVAPESSITDLVAFLPIKSPLQWAIAMSQITLKNSRDTYFPTIIAKNYDIASQAIILESVYGTQN